MACTRGDVRVGSGVRLHHAGGVHELEAVRADVEGVLEAYEPGSVEDRPAGDEAEETEARRERRERRALPFGDHGVGRPRRDGGDGAVDVAEQRRGGGVARHRREAFFEPFLTVQDQACHGRISSVEARPRPTPGRA